MNNEGDLKNQPMAGEKTAAQLQAEAAAAKAREDEAKRVEEKRRTAAASGWLQGFLPEFSFFNILLFVAMACGAYFLGRTEGGKELLGGIFGKENVDAFFAKGDGMLAGLASTLGINIDVGASLKKIPTIEAVRATLKGQNIPDPIIAVVAKDLPTFHKLLDVVAQANGGKVGLNDFMNDKTITALSTQMPELVRALATEATRAAPKGAANPMANQIKASLIAIVNSDQLDTLLNPANRANTIATMRAVLPANAGISPSTLTALVTHGIGEDGKATPQLRKLLTSAMDGSLQTLQASLNDAVGKFSLTKAVDVLLNPQSRALIRSIGPDNIAIAARDKSPELTPQLLNAALTFGDAIDKNPANGGAGRARAVAILHAVTNMASGIPPKNAFKGIIAEQLSGFFAVPGNQAAVGNLIGAAQPALKRYWGNADHGLAEVFASTPDADKILRFMRDDTTWLEKNVGPIVNTALDRSGASLEQKLYWLGGDKISENAADLAIVLPLLNPAAAAKATSPKR